MIKTYDLNLSTNLRKKSSIPIKIIDSKLLKMDNIAIASKHRLTNLIPP
jgi:hypothetical protein